MCFFRGCEKAVRYRAKNKSHCLHILTQPVQLSQPVYSCPSSQALSTKKGERSIVDVAFSPVAPLMSLLKTMTPVAVDSELRSLGPEGGGSVEQLAGFMRFLLERLRTRRDFELTEAYLGLFLKV